MIKSSNILVVEDHVEDFELIMMKLSKEININQCIRIQTEEELTTELSKNKWDLIISDNMLPKINGKRALKITKSYNDDIPFILVSGSIGEEAAVEMMLSGANDYILKSNLKRLVPAIKRELNDAQLRKNQRENKRKLIISDLRYQHLTESISEIFFALDKDFHITFWNRAAGEEFKKAVAEGSHILDVFPEWKGKKPFLNLQKSLNENISLPLSIQIKKNQIEYYEGSVSPAFNGISILLRRVTDRYLDQARLEYLNNELETLLYRIGHDLKGPVASVQGLLNIAKLDKDFDTEQFLKRTRDRMDDLQDTLEILLNLANIKSGETKKEKVNLLQLIDQIIKSFKNHPYANKVKYLVNVESDLSLFSDFSLLRCIWQNLIENSIKYGYDQNKGVIVNIEAKNTDEKVVMSIEDNGPGITPEISDKIFDMFYRGNVRSEGTGLGLYMVENATKKLGGSIRLDKQFKNGTRLELTFPR